MRLLDRIISENINKYLIKESISSIVYHFTDIDALLHILRKDRFQLSSVYINDGDDEYYGKETFFLSVTRQRNNEIGFSGYIGGLDVRITIDGSKINQRYRGLPVDFFKGGKVESYKKFPIDKYQKQTESEDRIFSHNPTIEQASKYILRIDILVMRNMCKKVNYIMNTFSDKYNIYVYDNIRDFNYQTKNTIPQEELNNQDKDAVEKALVMVDSMNNSENTVAEYSKEIIGYLLAYNHITDKNEAIVYINDLFSRYGLEKYIGIAKKIIENLNLATIKVNHFKPGVKHSYLKGDLYVKFGRMLGDFCRKNKINVLK